MRIVNEKLELVVDGDRLNSADQSIDLVVKDLERCQDHPCIEQVHVLTLQALITQSLHLLHLVPEVVIEERQVDFKILEHFTEQNVRKVLKLVRPNVDHLFL